MSEKTATREKTKPMNEKETDGGDDSNDEGQVEDENYLLEKLADMTRAKTMSQQREYAVNKFKRAMDELQSKDFNSNRCRFKNSRTGQRCPHNRNQKYGKGKYCKDHHFYRKTQRKKTEEKKSVVNVKVPINKKAKSVVIDLGPPPSVSVFDFEGELQAYSANADDQDLLARFTRIGGKISKVYNNITEAEVKKSEPQVPASGLIDLTLKEDLRQIADKYQNANSGVTHFDRTKTVKAAEMRKSMNTGHVPATSVQKPKSGIDIASLMNNINDYTEQFSKDPMNIDVVN